MPGQVPRSPASPLFIFTQEISPPGKPTPVPLHCQIPVHSPWHCYFSHLAFSYLDAFHWIRWAPGLEMAQSFVVYCADELPQVVLFRDALGHEVVYYLSKGRVLVEGCQCVGHCPFAAPPLRPSYAQVVATKQ